jgi:uncharacterized BrkB/YihY/UPF0761 family membrane protein
MLLWLIRAAFVLMVAGLGSQVARLVSDTPLVNPFILFLGMIVAALLVVAVDILTPRKRIQTISAIYFGVIVGLILNDLVQTAVEPMLVSFMHEDARKAFSGMLLIFICYICVSALLQTTGSAENTSASTRRTTSMTMKTSTSVPKTGQPCPRTRCRLRPKEASAPDRSRTMTGMITAQIVISHKPGMITRNRPIAIAIPARIDAAATGHT